MATKDHPVNRFRSEIATLIAAVESCMPSQQPDQDREFGLQREAFRERCQQAKTLASRLGVDNRFEWCLRSGDAHRIEESLKLSLAYFRRCPVG